MCLTPCNRSAWAFLRKSTSEDDQLAATLLSIKIRTGNLPSGNIDTIC